jgi:hypothetical protein
MELSELLGRPLLDANTPATYSPAVGLRPLNAGGTETRRLFTLARMSLGWKRGLQAVNRVWSKSWTAETCSYIVSILSLAGLVTTLMAHEEKPLPQWPQLVNINSIISLFSLVMRTCVGVVLTEGTLSARLAHCEVYNI